jgi:hypothetical protein
VRSAEAAQIERTDDKAKSSEMGAQIASPVGFARVLKHEEQHAEFPPLGMADGAPTLRDFRIGPEEADRLVIVSQQSAISRTGYRVEKDDAGPHQLRRNPAGLPPEKRWGLIAV